MQITRSASVQYHRSLSSLLRLSRYSLSHLRFGHPQTLSAPPPLRAHPPRMALHGYAVVELVLGTALIS